MSTESKDKTLINMPPPPPEYPGHDKLLPPEPVGYPVPDYPPPAYSSVQESSSKDKSMIQVELGQESAKIICQNCFYEVHQNRIRRSTIDLVIHYQVSTRVDSTVSTSGWAWAIICCFCGSWIASCLVNCLPGFRKYTHSCPNCK